MTELVTHESTNMIDQYAISDVAIAIPANDTDIDLQLPDGSSILIQFRPESNTVDVCLPQNMRVINWIGNQMKPAPKIGLGHVRNCGQLCIALPDNCLRVGTDWEL